MQIGIGSLYERYLLPTLVDRTCGCKPQMKQRAKIVPLAQGRVLEVGAGSGRNLAFYDARRVTRLWALDPSAEMAGIGRRRAAHAGIPVEFVQGRAEQMPLDSGSVDTVVLTYTLCTIAEPVAALVEMRRVLKRGGRLLFCEHGLAPDRSVRRWQKRLNPFWRRISGGCNLDREIPDLVGQGGFHLREVSCMYIPGWRPVSYNYWGVAAA